MLQLRRRSPRAERGFALVYLAISITVLLGISGFALDVGNWYYSAQKQQKAADAAALAGVVYLPGDPATAYARACDISSRNGFGDTSCPTGSAVTATQVPGNPTQLQVSVRTVLTNYFASFLGYRKQTIIRRATAEYLSPVAMGSPANVFGNEPVTSNDTPWANSGYIKPNLWNNVHGQQSSKGNGDALQPTNCSGVPDRCPGPGNDATSNSDYSKDGYIYRVAVDPAIAALHKAAGDSLAIEIFDPATIFVGDHCTANATLAAASAASNDYTTKSGSAPNDAAKRYKFGDTTTDSITPGAGDFCTGDNSDGFDAAPQLTSYAVRQDLDPYNPANNKLVDQPGCTGLQFPGYSGSEDLGADLNQAGGGYKRGVAALFRQWVPICAFDPSTAPASDYLLQIRSNLLPNAASGINPETKVASLPKTSLGGGVATGAMDGPGDPTNPRGGSNRFAIRAAWVSGPYQVDTNYTAGGLPTLAGGVTPPPPTTTTTVGPTTTTGSTTTTTGSTTTTTAPTTTTTTAPTTTTTAPTTTTRAPTTTTRAPTPTTQGCVNGNGNCSSMGQIPFQLASAPLGPGEGLQVFAAPAMGVYANASSANASNPATSPNFYMARIPSGVGGQTLQIGLWDIGDCSGSGCSPTLSFQLPVKSDGSANSAPSCKIYQGFTDAGTPQATGCSFVVNGSGLVSASSWLTIDINLPSDYSCQDSLITQCWVRMRYTVGGSATSGNALNDTTTWTAKLLGDPVRLVK